MKSILAATLLASSALASTLSFQPDDANTTNKTLLTRQDGATAEGTDSGIQISIYTSKDCKGDEVVTKADMLYAKNFIWQMQSYSLSADLSADDILSFGADADWTYAGTKPVDKSLNGVPSACAIDAYNAAPDHVTHGCHSLKNVVGCVGIWKDEAPVS